MAVTVPTQLYIDQNGQPIPVPVGSGSRVNLTAGSSTSNSALPTSTSGLVIVRATDYVWLNFGTGAVTASAAATSILMAPGEGVYRVPTTATHVAVLRVGSSDVAVQLESLLA